MRFNRKNIGATTGNSIVTYVDHNGNRRLLKSYDRWQSMINRCYSESYHKKNPSYVGCTVSKEWLDYEVFKEWFDDNYIEGYQIDKDMLIIGNKVYSSESCSFIPAHLNSILTDHKRSRGDYPQGVTKCRYGFQARINIHGKNKNIGHYKTPELAFEAYKRKKEEHVREVALEYFCDGAIKFDIYYSICGWTLEYDEMNINKINTYNI